LIRVRIFEKMALMKLIFFTLLFSTGLLAKPLVLISHYDSFGGAKSNNSETVAKALEKHFSKADSPIRVKLCSLETKFDVAFTQTEKCLQEEKPDMVLGLGETGCNLKIEILGRNLDHTRGADNAGVERKKSEIITDAPEAIGFSYPLAEMYCAVEKKDRKKIFVSSDAGSFVCNNTAFQLAFYYPKTPSGFIHVPLNSCRRLEKINREVISQLISMLSKVAEIDLEESYRLPTDSYRVREFREYWEERDECKHEFFKRTRGVD
jgi:pyrrolidone-carboxylate peptidase